MSIPVVPGGHESSDPNDPDGIMSDQEMPTADGQMASNTSEEERPPRAQRDGPEGDQPDDPGATLDPVP